MNQCGTPPQKDTPTTTAPGVSATEPATPAQSVGASPVESNADALVVVAGTPASVNEIQEGRYTVQQIADAVVAGAVVVAERTLVVDGTGARQTAASQ